MLMARRNVGLMLKSDLSNKTYHKNDYDEFIRNFTIVDKWPFNETAYYNNVFGKVICINLFSLSLTEVLSGICALSVKESPNRRVHSYSMKKPLNKSVLALCL